MAAQVEVQSGDVGRTMTAGRPHLSPLTDSSNTSPSITPLHIITPEPQKPVPGPKPRLTPKPFAAEKKNSIKPILAPKPQIKPRPESTNTAGYKPEPPNSSEPQQPDAIVKPRPVSTSSIRPASTSFRTSTKLNTGQTTKPVVHPFKPAPPFDSVDTSKKTPPLPAERKKPKMTPIQGGASIARAKSLGFLHQIEKEDEQNQSVTVVPPRPQPRGSRPRPVSAVFLNNPDIPVPAPRLAGGKPLSSDLTSKFESIGLSLHRKAARADVKESTPKEKALPQKTQQEKNSTSGQNTGIHKKSNSDDQSNDISEKKSVKETNEDQRGATSIKSRINLLLDSSSTPETVSSGQTSALLPPEQTVRESEPQVGVKQLIKQLTEDITSSQSPVMKPAFKPRNLSADLTKKFSSERLFDLDNVSLSEAAEYHEISKVPQEVIDEVNPSGKTAVEFQHHLKTISSVTESPEAEHVPSTTSNQIGPSVEVQTIRASFFDNIVERSSVTNGNDLLCNPSWRKGNNEVEGTLLTVIYKDSISPSPQRVNHAMETVQAMSESRVVSESIPSAQREDKAMTLRSRRSEGNRPPMETKGEPPSTMATEQQPQYLRIGSLQKWPSTDVSQEADVENATLKQSQKGTEMDLSKDKDRVREADHEEIAAAPKRMKTLQIDEKPKPKATYFALTGQIQESDTGSNVLESAVPYDDIDSGQESSQGKVAAIKRNLSLNATLGENQEKYEDVSRMSHITARQVVSALDVLTSEKMTEVVKPEQTKEDERQNGQMKIIDRDKQRQMEIERQAIFQFSQMKERELQRDFERRKTFEREKQKQSEIQNHNPQGLEYENMKEIEKQRELHFKQEQEMQRRQDVERQRELERQKDLEKQRQQEIHRQREQEKERQNLQRQREQELERQRALMRKKEQEMERQLEQMRMREQEKERERELERLQELMRLKEQEKERQEELRRLKEQEKEQQKELDRQREMERQQELMRLREQEEERQREVERQQELMRLREQEERLQEHMRLKEQEMERQQQLERQKEHEKERRRELERQQEQLRQREQEMDRQRDRERQQEQLRLREQELERRRELKRQQERLRQREQEMERQELQQQEQMRLREEKMERLRELERQQRERDMERQRELAQQQEKVRLKEQETERRRELKRQQERLRQREQEMEREQELEHHQGQVRLREQELERQQEIKKQQQQLRQREQEMERQRELAQQQEKVRLKEQEMERKQELQELESQQEQVQLMEQENERQRGFHKQRELDQERQREWERQRQKEEERQTELDKEALLLEMQRNKRMEELGRVKEKVERKLLDQKQKQKEIERYLYELEQQRYRENAEKTKLMASEQELLRLKGFDKERGKRQLEREYEEELEREKFQDLDRLRDLQREKQLHAERQNQKLIQQTSQSERLRWEAEREKMEKAEAEKMRQIARLQEAERHRLKDKQRKEEQERMRVDQLRPKVVDVDSLLRTATTEHIDPALRWKEPSPRVEEPYKPSILDVDSFTSQSQPFSNPNILPVSSIQEVDSNFGNVSRPGPERDITWKIPPQNSVDLASPVWTISSRDPRELQSTEMSHNKPLHEPRKHTTKVSPEQLLFRHDEHSLPPQSHWRHRAGEPLYLDPFVQKEATFSRAPVDQVWLPRQLKSQDIQEDIRNRRRSQGSQELTRMRSRSMSRRSAPSGVALEKSLSRIRSRSAHREQDHHSWEQQKQGEDKRKDSETPVGETDSQYGTWETGLRTDDSLTPATPSSESNLSPSPRNATPSHAPGERDSVDGLHPPSKSENEPLSFPDAPTTLLDTGVLRSRVQLGKKRAPRTRPSRAARQNTTQDGATSDDWLYRDSTEEKLERKMDEVDSEEQAGGADAAATSASQPQRVALFPGVDSQALKVQLKKRSDSDNQSDAPSPSLPSRSPKSPFLPRAARVLPPAGGKENGEEESPRWLKELKSKKRLSQYVNDS
ncbi:uncharacterized protein LOC144019141 [Festucalex cinctus]